MSCFRPSIEGWLRCRAVGRVNNRVWYKFDALHGFFFFWVYPGREGGVALRDCGSFHCIRLVCTVDRITILMDTTTSESI